MSRSTITPSNPATQKQLLFIERLVIERELDQELSDWVCAVRHFAFNGSLSATGASQLIDALLDAPKKL